MLDDENITDQIYAHVEGNRDMSQKKSIKVALALAAFFLTFIPIVVVLHISWEVQQLVNYRSIRSLESIEEFVKNGIPKQSSRSEVEEWLKQNNLVSSFTSVVNQELGNSSPTLPMLAGLDANELGGMLRVICDDAASLDEFSKGSLNRIYFFFDKNSRYVGHLVRCA
jgi:hypothetical protein